MTITQTVAVPANRKINLTLPDDIPPGQATIKLHVPGKADVRLPIISWFENRRIEANRKAIERASGCLAHNPAFHGSGVELIREMRDEWDDEKNRL